MAYGKQIRLYAIRMRDGDERGSGRDNSRTVCLLAPRLGVGAHGRDVREIDRVILIGKMVADSGEVPGRTGVPAGTVLYKVLWAGFPPEIATREEEDDIPCGHRWILCPGTSVPGYESIGAGEAEAAEDRAAAAAEDDENSDDEVGMRTRDEPGGAVM